MAIYLFCSCHTFNGALLVNSFQTLISNTLIEMFRRFFFSPLILFIVAVSVTKYFFSTHFSWWANYTSFVPTCDRLRSLWVLGLLKPSSCHRVFKSQLGHVTIQGTSGLLNRYILAVMMMSPNVDHLLFSLQVLQLLTQDNPNTLNTSDPNHSYNNSLCGPHFCC